VAFPRIEEALEGPDSDIRFENSEGLAIGVYFLIFPSCEINCFKIEETLYGSGADIRFEGFKKAGIDVAFPDSTLSTAWELNWPRIEEAFKGLKGDESSERSEGRGPWVSLASSKVRWLKI